MDALSDVFAAVRLSGGVFLDAEFSAPWCVESQVGPEEFPQGEMPAHLIAYHYVVAGRMFVQVGGDAVEVAAGEIVMLPRNDGHLLASAPGLRPTPIDAHLQPPDAGTPAALRLMVDRVGISKQNSLLDISLLEGALRDDLDAAAPRRMAVIDPVKLVLANLPDGHEETLTFSNHPKDESFGQRSVPFSRELWIEREDFEEVPPKGFKRLTTGGEVRLRGAGIVRCDEVVKNDAGEIVELRGWLDPESRPGMAGAERKIKGTIHWVSAQHAVAAEIRLYDRLFTVPNPDDESEGKTYRDYMNPDSRRTVTGYVEPAAASAAPEQWEGARRQAHNLQHARWLRTCRQRVSSLPGSAGGGLLVSVCYVATTGLHVVFWHRDKSTTFKLSVNSQRAGDKRPFPTQRPN